MFANHRAQWCSINLQTQTFRYCNIARNIKLSNSMRKSDQRYGYFEQVEHIGIRRISKFAIYKTKSSSQSHEFEMDKRELIY